MKKLILAILLVITVFSTLALAETPVAHTYKSIPFGGAFFNENIVANVKYYGGNGMDYGRHLSKSDEGALIIAGRTESDSNTGDIGTRHTSGHRSADGLLMRLNDELEASCVELVGSGQKTERAWVTLLGCSKFEDGILYQTEEVLLNKGGSDFYDANIKKTATRIYTQKQGEDAIEVMSIHDVLRTSFLAVTKHGILISVKLADPSGARMTRECVMEINPQGETIWEYQQPYVKGSGFISEAILHAAETEDGFALVLSRTEHTEEGAVNQTTLLLVDSNGVLQHERTVGHDIVVYGISTNGESILVYGAVEFANQRYISLLDNTLNVKWIIQDSAYIRTEYAGFYNEKLIFACRNLDLIQTSDGDFNRYAMDDLIIWESEGKATCYPFVEGENIGYLLVEPCENGVLIVGNANENIFSAVCMLN